MGKLAVTRYPEETVVIRVPGHEDIIVNFVKVRFLTGKRPQVRLMIEAPEEVTLIRGEKVDGWIGKPKMEGVVTT